MGEKRFKCGTCDEWHDGLPDLCFLAPDMYLEIDPAERETQATKSADLCTIRDDEFFVRAVLEIPIVGQDERLGFGVWVSLSAANYARYVAFFDAPVPKDEGPYFGWLCNRFPHYPDTLFLKTRVHLRSGGLRPLVELQPTDHPLSINQRDGIAFEEACAIAESVLHPKPV